MYVLEAWGFKPVQLDFFILVYNLFFSIFLPFVSISSVYIGILAFTGRPFDLVTDMI